MLNTLRHFNHLLSVDLSSIDLEGEMTFLLLCRKLSSFKPPQLLRLIKPPDEPRRVGLSFRFLNDREIEDGVALAKANPRTFDTRWTAEWEYFMLLWTHVQSAGRGDRIG